MVQGDYSANSSNMNNRPTLTFDANEPLDNPTARPFATATNFTRVFVGRYSGGTYNMAFEDGMSGYGLYINTANNRIDSYYSYGNRTGRGANRTNNTSSYTHGNPFIYTTYLDTDERNYTNADKAFYERDGVEYNHGSVDQFFHQKTPSVGIIMVCSMV